MLKLSVGVALLLAAAALTGCGGQTAASPTSTPPPPAPTNTPAPTPKTIPTALLQTPTIVATASTPGVSDTATANPVVTATPGIEATSLSTGTLPTPISAPKIDVALGGFSLALIQGDTTGAETYLTNALQATTPATALPAALGLQTAPSRYNYVLSQETPSGVIATMTYHVSTGNVVDRIVLVKNGTNWQIAAIDHLSG